MIDAASTLTQQHEKEIRTGNRFAFGENWGKFLKNLNPNRVAESERDLKEMLEVQTLEGKTFLDIGSGSGLSSLAARNLGAKVFSFDYDPQSVACTEELRARFHDGSKDWQVQHGSALDTAYLNGLGKFDIVYSWGVLHHTGDMWLGLTNVLNNVAADGKLFLALYNDQGRKSRYWKRLKKFYVALPRSLQFLIIWPAMVRLWGPSIFRDTLSGNPTKSWKNYKSSRGMSPYHDVVDWIGGYPFEVSKPEEIFDFYRAHGFNLIKMKTCGGGLGCNQFIFKKLKFKF